MFAFTAVPTFAGPFADVPSSHWAYKAISDLAAKGVLEGYPNAKFQGGKAMTRYEAAAMVARALEKGLDSATLEKLTVEFADELALLGVKVTALEDEVKAIRGDLDVVKSDVEMLKAGGFGNIKVSGEYRVRFADFAFDKVAEGTTATWGRFRMNYDIAVDKNVTAYVTADVDNNLWGRNDVTRNAALDEGINLFNAYIDVKNFGGIADMRIGRQPIVLGKGVILDDSIDAVTFNRMYRGTLFTFGIADMKDHAGALANFNFNTGLGLFGANDGMQTKMFAVSRMFQNSFTLGAYVLAFDTTNLSIKNVCTAPNDPLLYGVHLDGKIVKDLLGFIEYASWEMDDTTGITNTWDYNLYKMGLEWTINKDFDATLLYGHRDDHAPILSIYDDYTDSIFWGASDYRPVNAHFFGNGGPNGDSYLNSDYLGFIFGAKLNQKTQLDLWYEALTGDETQANVTVGTTTYACDNVFDQDAFQLVATHQYRDNTSFKFRYRTITFDDGDSDYKVAGVKPADYDEYRLDMTIKF